MLPVCEVCGIRLGLDQLVFCAARRNRLAYQSKDVRGNDSEAPVTWICSAHEHRVAAQPRAQAVEARRSRRARPGALLAPVGSLLLWGWIFVGGGWGTLALLFRSHARPPAAVPARAFQSLPVPASPGRHADIARQQGPGAAMKQQQPGSADKQASEKSAAPSPVSSAPSLPQSSAANASPQTRIPAPDPPHAARETPPAAPSSRPAPSQAATPPRAAAAAVPQTSPGEERHSSPAIQEPAPAAPPALQPLPLTQAPAIEALRPSPSKGSPEARPPLLPTERLPDGSFR
jgi:hypothetical protein